MPVALSPISEPPVRLSPPRKRWTRAECAVLASTGILDQEKLELIQGELIDKMGKNRPHVNALLKAMKWLVETFGWDRVNPETPIDVAPKDNPTNEPQPDLIVLRRPSATFGSAPPQPTDLDLVVEISDTSLAFDLTVKASLYARAGILEYWVLDVNARRLIVHLDPTPAGYRSIVAYGESEKVAPQAALQRELIIGDLFPS